MRKKVKVTTTYTVVVEEIGDIEGEDVFEILEIADDCGHDADIMSGEVVETDVICELMN